MSVQMDASKERVDSIDYLIGVLDRHCGSHGCRMFGENELVIFAGRELLDGIRRESCGHRTGAYRLDPYCYGMFMGVQVRLSEELGDKALVLCKDDLPMSWIREERR